MYSMYSRRAASSAFTEASTASLEYGMGYALYGKDGFFCGFEQSDGSLVFNQISQKIESGAPEFNGSMSEYSKDRPIFLTLEQMQILGCAAAAYGTKQNAVFDNSLPSDFKKNCRVVFVRKDVTHSKSAFEEDNILQRPIYLSQAGFASAEACSDGYDRGYLSNTKTLTTSAIQIAKRAKEIFTYGFVQNQP